MDPDKTIEAVDDDSALDKELADSIQAVQAGKALEEQPTVAEPETKEEEPNTPEPEKKEEEASDPQAEEPKEEKYEFRIPNKGKFESDESYEKRVELFDLVKRRKTATSPEAKQHLSEQIATTKNQLKTLNGTDKINNSFTKSVEPAKDSDEDPALKADRERLKELGGATKEDIAEIVRQERIAADTKSTVDKFLERHADLKDEDVREVFFDFVDTNYNWAGKTGKELMTVLELARESMFKPSESIQERVLKAANVQEKINAMQFPGGTIAKGGYSPEMQKSIDELKATGISEEKALELLSD